MGFNTTVVILNDALHEIESDPDFGKNLVAAVMKTGLHGLNGHDVPAGCHGNAVRVIETHHADGMHAVLVGGNTGDSLGRVLGYNYDLSKLEDKKRLLRNLADNLGLTVRVGQKESK